MTVDLDRRVRLARAVTLLFIVGLIISGLTAQPLETEMRLAGRFVRAVFEEGNGLRHWIERIERDIIAINNSPQRYVFYGNDWLSFGHLAIAGAFVPAVQNPIRHRWLYTYGLVLCVAVIPWALICGTIRGIPLGWQMIDMSFGVLGAIPLLLCWWWTNTIQAANPRHN